MLASMSDPDRELDGPMDPEDEVRTRLLTEAELRVIDECILSNITDRFHKTARVVALTMRAMNNRFNLPDVFYSGRIKLLAQSGVIEAAGNLDRMRYSEVRLADRED